MASSSISHQSPNSDMSRLPPLSRRVQIVAYSVIAISTLLTVILVIVGYLQGNTTLFDLLLNPRDAAGQAIPLDTGNIPVGVIGQINNALALIAWFISFCVGILILVRARGDRLAMITAYCLMASDTTGALFNLTTDRTWGSLALILYILPSMAWLGFVLTFPNGRFVPRWSKWLFLGCVFLTGLYLFASLIVFRDSQLASSLLTSLYGLIIIGVFVLAIGVQVYRYIWKSTPIERQQLKWVLVGLASSMLLGVLSILTIVPMFIFGGTFWTAALVAVMLLTSAGMSFIAIAIAIAVLRYRLWDVDMIIHRGMVYGGLTLCLAVIFGLGYLLLQAVLGQLIPQQHSAVAIASSTALAVGAFSPTRRVLQGLVDKRFFGIQIDYRDQRLPKSENGLTLTRTQLGDYQDLEPIGRGGMAEVYRATHPTLERAVAIKILSAALAKDEDFRRRFEREAHMIALLRHTNIVQLFDFGAHDDTYYMVMEYIDGPNLADRLHSGTPMRLDEALPLLGDIASALDYAHAQGIVHRDIKPSNIMLRQPNSSVSASANREQAVLTDFGIAKMLGASTRLTTTGIMGTFDYMSPEQIRDSADVDGRADIYALGVTAYQMLTGQLPFKGSNAGAILIAHLQQPVPDPRLLRPNLPEAISTAIRQALAKEPERRLNSAAELIQAMRIETQVEAA